jgi:hypothetical protein
MGVLDFLEKLQKKSEASRRRILALTLFAIMAAIVIIWFTTFDLSLKNQDALKSVAGPFGFLKQDLSDFYGYIKNFKQNIR